MIYVRLSGQWTTAIDLAYLSELIENIRAMRGQTWGLIADLREWVIAPEVAGKNSGYVIDIQRRNQIAEAWIVNHPEQGQHLEDFFNEYNFAPERVQTEDELEQWAQKHQLPLDKTFYAR